MAIAASNAGDASQPAWFHILVADPAVTFGGIPMQAAVVADEDARQRLWLLADCVAPAFANYRRDAATHGRTIPIVQLTSV